MPFAVGNSESKRTDVLGRLPDRSLSIREKIERSIGHNIRQVTPNQYQATVGEGKAG